MASNKIDSEQAIIGAFFAPLAAGFPGAFDLSDDCAAIAPEPGTDLVVTTDALIAGVHFLPEEDAAAVGWKALAVNVSDLVAKGAQPLAYVMSLALPGAPEHNWLAAFTAGLNAAQTAFGCHLIGGDTDRTPGPLSVSITAFGGVPSGRIVRRSGARPGDLLYVSGTIGDSTLGLALRRDSAAWPLDASARQRLQARHLKPAPPVALAPVLVAAASAAMDLSDGLVKDFGRLCAVSGVGGVIEAERVPLSPEARALVTAGAVSLADLLTGGEDYEVLMAAKPERAAELERLAQEAGVPVTCIGTVEAGGGARVVDAGGRELAFATTGWDHFSGSARSE